MVLWMGWPFGRLGAACAASRSAGGQVAAYLGNGVLDNLLVGHIALVADEQLVDALGGVSVNLLKPLLDVVEGVHVGDIVDDADAVGAAVVGRGDGAETLLAGGIPLQQTHRSVSHCDKRSV